MSEAAVADSPAPKKAGMQRMLDGIERVGNKVPHPAIIFLSLCGLVIVLSAIFAAIGVHVTYETAAPPPSQVDRPSTTWRRIYRTPVLDLIFRASRRSTGRTTTLRASRSASCSRSRPAAARRTAAIARRRRGITRASRPSP